MQKIVLQNGFYSRLNFLHMFEIVFLSKWKMLSFQSHASFCSFLWQNKHVYLHSHPRDYLAYNKRSVFYENGDASFGHMAWLDGKCDHYFFFLVLHLVKSSWFEVSMFNIFTL